MSVKDDIEAVNRIEEKFDLSRLTYQGEKIWPAIRAYLQLEQLVKSAKAGKAGNLSKWKRLRTILDSVLNYYFHDRKQSRFKLKKAEMLFVFDMLPKVKNSLNGKWMNKFAEGIFPYLDPSKSSCYIEYSLINQFKTPRNTSSYYMNPGYFKFLLKEKLFGKKASDQIQGFGELVAFMEKEGISLPLEEEIMLGRLRKIFLFKKFFLGVLKKVKPKVVIYPVYISNLNLGLVLACRELGIKTVEIQHGQQGFYNLAYSHWKNYPEQGYSFHPDMFWMWSDENCKRITSWAGHTNIEAINGGNPWLNFYKTRVFKKQNNLDSLGKLTADKRTKILVATQLPNDFLSNFVPNVMSRNHPDLLWLIRIHPDQMVHKDKIRKALEQKGCTNFEMEIASSAPLYTLFEIVEFNVTFWSTVAYEAELFDVKNIIAHEHGLLSMNRYIDEGVFAYASNEEEFMKALREFEFKKPQSNYIDYEAKYIQNGLNEVYRLAGLS